MTLESSNHPALNEQQATAILEQVAGYQSAGCDYTPRTICLDGDYSVEELEALAWWARNKPDQAFPKFKTRADEA